MAGHEMVVDHAGGLHEGVDDGRPDELETARDEFLRHLGRDRRRGGHRRRGLEVVDLRLAVHEIPEEGGKPQRERSNWETLSILAETIADHELASEAGPLLIYKLFHELNPRGLDPWNIEFGCSCSKERSSRALKALGEKEVRQMFAEQPSLSVDCHFCGRVYQYDQADLEWLLSDQPPRSDTLQ